MKIKKWYNIKVNKNKKNFMDKTLILEKYIEDIIKLIVRKPESVQIYSEVRDTLESGKYVLFSAVVHRNDVSLCIGSGGCIIASIRKITTAKARMLGYEMNVSVRIDAPPIKKAEDKEYQMVKI